MALIKQIKIAIIFFCATLELLRANRFCKWSCVVSIQKMRFDLFPFVKNGYKLSRCFCNMQRRATVHGVETHGRASLESLAVCPKKRALPFVSGKAQYHGEGCDVCEHGSWFHDVSFRRIKAGGFVSGPPALIVPVERRVDEKRFSIYYRGKGVGVLYTSL